MTLEINKFLEIVWTKECLDFNSVTFISNSVEREIKIS
jgi:hypothetical protein